MATLHIFGQYQWHDDAGIVGDKEALIKLRAAIDKALEDSEARTSAMTNDGEGYDVLVVCREDFEQVAFPYISEIAAERRAEAFYPSELVSDYLKLKGLK